MTTVEVKINSDSWRTEFTTERGTQWVAVSEALEVLLRALGDQDRELVLGDLCRTFNYRYEP